MSTKIQIKLKPSIQSPIVIPTPPIVIPTQPIVIPTQLTSKITIKLKSVQPNHTLQLSQITQINNIIQTSNVKIPIKRKSVQQNQTLPAMILAQAIQINALLPNQNNKLQISKVKIPIKLKTLLPPHPDFVGGIYEGYDYRKFPICCGQVKYQNGVIVKVHFNQGQLDLNSTCTVTFPTGKRLIGIITQQANGQISGRGQYCWKNHWLYNGFIKNNQFDGQGKVTYNDRRLIRHAEGLWQNREIKGSAKITYLDYSHYEGETITENLIRHGKGQITWKNGDKYDGEWQNALYHGLGQMIYHNFDVYNGDWSHHKKHGQGILSYHTGIVYEGHFANDMRDGQGQMTYINSPRKLYIGQWKLDQFNGQGSLTYKNGDVYTGQWLNGLRHGLGKMVWSNGYTYTGDFIADKITGQGVKTWNSIKTYTGTFKDGICHGLGTVTTPQGDIHEVTWVEDKMTGYGKLKFPSGNVYEGDLLNDNFHGYGTYTYINGQIFQGYYTNNQRNGFGQLTLANGKVYQGQWINDYNDVYNRDLLLSKLIKIKTQQIKKFIKLPQTSLGTSWQRLAHHSVNRKLTSVELKQIHTYAKIIKVDPDLSTRQLFVIFSKYLEKFTILPLKYPLKNDDAFDGTPFKEIPPTQIIQDDLGYCFTLEEMPQLQPQSKPHPYTSQPWTNIMVQGQPFLDYVEILKNNIMSPVNTL